MATVKRSGDSTHAPRTLDKSSLVRDIYRALLQNGRTYAAFEQERVVVLVEKLQEKGPILDPMSGYGTLTTVCARLPEPVGTTCMELNPPSYLWQVLCLPANRAGFIKACEYLIANRKNWPRARCPAALGSDWFPEESLDLLFGLFGIVMQAISGCRRMSSARQQLLGIALLLPFAGRFSSCVQGNVVTHVKRGGIVVFKGWEEDFLSYLACVRDRLRADGPRPKRVLYELKLCDARYSKLPRLARSMITSPPYPNGRSYSAMFHPENALLRIFEGAGLVKGLSFYGRLIGSPTVCSQHGYTKATAGDVNSETARDFLKKVQNYKGTKQAEYDNRIYYLPYFAQYFSGLEQAYRNLAKNVHDSFEGYIVVVNNTHRRQVIPVAETVAEIWKNMGFKVSFMQELTRELAHLGGINPRARGLAARHTEYTLQVTRN